MKAAYLKKHGGPEVLEYGELPEPNIDSDEVLVRVEYSALNHLDIWVRKGLPSLKLSYPHILGSDAAGVVARVGRRVTHVKEGDPVVIHPGVSPIASPKSLLGWETLCPGYGILGENRPGTNAEFVAVPAANVFMRPNGLSAENAAAVPLVYTTAWQMLVTRGKVKPGDRVLIHGAGSGVTTAAIQIAKLFGAEVMVTSGHEAKLVKAGELGADHLVNHAKSDFLAEVKKWARAGVDLVVDHVGQTFWEKNIQATRSGGTIVTCGATSGWEAKTDLRHVFFRQIQILGSTMGSKGDFPRILNLVSNGKLKPVVDTVFPVTEIQNAHRHLEDRKQFGKVIIKLL